MLRYLAQPAPLLGVVLAVVVGFLGHNLAQAWATRALGDGTAVRAGFGRLDRRQLDVLGVVAAILTVNAWGFTAPVPIDPRARGRHRGRAAAGLLAGPVFLLAVTVALAALEAQSLSSFATRAVAYAEVCSAGLFVTSMIPIPPLALGRALWLYLPTTGGWSSARYRLEEENLGRLIAFAILLIPLVFGSFPDLVGEFVTPLLNHLTTAFVTG